MSGSLRNHTPDFTANSEKRLRKASALRSSKAVMSITCSASMPADLAIFSSACARSSVIGPSEWTTSTKTRHRGSWPTSTNTTSGSSRLGSNSKPKALAAARRAAVGELANKEKTRVHPRNSCQRLDAGPQSAHGAHAALLAKGGHAPRHMRCIWLRIRPPAWTSHWPREPSELHPQAGGLYVAG